MPWPIAHSHFPSAMSPERVCAELAYLWLEPPASSPDGHSSEAAQWERARCCCGGGASTTGPGPRAHTARCYSRTTYTGVEQGPWPGGVVVSTGWESNEKVMDIVTHSSLRMGMSYYVVYILVLLYFKWILKICCHKSEWERDKSIIKRAT